MGKSVFSGGNTPSGPPRPSLLNPAPSSQSPNILDAMGGASSRIPAPAPARKLKAGLLLLPLAGLALWGLMRTPLSSAPESAPPAQLVFETPHPQSPLRVAAVEPAAASLPTKPAVEQASPFAELGSETPAADTPPTAVPVVTPVPEPPATAQLPPNAPPVVAAAPKPIKVAAPAAAQPKPAAKSPVSKPVAKQPPRSARATGASDPDAALIDAILKNLGTSRSPQTIADLVKTCQGKDSIDGLICRRRICDGFWGKADVCPMNLAPQSVRNSQADTSGVAPARASASQVLR